MIIAQFVIAWHVRWLERRCFAKYAVPLYLYLFYTRRYNFEYRVPADGQVPAKLHMLLESREPDRYRVHPLYLCNTRSAQTPFTGEASHAATGISSHSQASGVGRGKMFSKPPSIHQSHQSDPLCWDRPDTGHG